VRSPLRPCTDRPDVGHDANTRRSANIDQTLHFSIGASGTPYELVSPRPAPLGTTLRAAYWLSTSERPKEAITLGKTDNQMRRSLRAGNGRGEPHVARLLGPFAFSIVPVSLPPPPGPPQVSHRS